ncbi:MAG: hypothetical protein IJC52_03150 [Clostridia bacterium]|nr:hypothetical protein [Clostridia bacterium]
MAVCAFSKVSLKDTFYAYWPFGTELYARLLYVATDNTEVLLAAVDTNSTFRKETVVFRERVAEKTGIPADNIWYHELQIHAAPNADSLFGEAMEKIADRVADEVLRMKEAAVPFTCEVATKYAGQKYTMNREQYVAGLGGVTVWAGLKFDENGTAYSSDPSRMLLRGYQPDLPVFDNPIYFDNPVDPLAYLFVFRNEQGEVIGTMSRFAAHPDVSVLFESHGVSDYKFDFDWPGYLCEEMEAHFGAPAMYINGPCANLATKKGFVGYDTYEASTAESKRIGLEFAAMLIERYDEKHVPLKNPDNLKAARFVFELPIKEDFPTSVEELRGLYNHRQEALDALQNAIDEDAPAYQVKQLIDDCYRRIYMHEYADHTCAFSDEELQSRKNKVDVTALQLGDYLFIGVPGESLVEMTSFLRETFTGAKTIPVDQVNGYYSYMATPTSMTLGGYTYWYSWVRRDGIPQLKNNIIEAMEGFLE